MVIAKKYIIKKHFEGEPKPTDLEIVEEELPDLKDGEFLTEAEYLSVDPYMRKYSERLPIGATMLGAQVALITQSRNFDYPKGKWIFGYMGWRTRTVMHPDNFDAFSLTGRKPYLVTNFEDLSLSTSLGVLGQPGLTAYFGLTEICEPKPGETLVVSGAAGAVGSLVGQMAKILGLRAIGITGSDEKCDYLINELGFDHAINYKTHNVTEELKKAAPHGIDCYFDNVGGDISSQVLYQMKPFGRIAVCGSISSYNSEPSILPKCTIIQPVVVANQLTIRGFLVARWKERRQEGLDRIYEWIRDGKLKYKETVTQGFENMFQAFLGMMRGENIGKAVVRNYAADTPRPEFVKNFTF